MSGALNGSSVRVTRTPPPVTDSVRRRPAWPFAAVGTFAADGPPVRGESAGSAASTRAPWGSEPGTGTPKATAVTGRSLLDVLHASQSPPHRRRHHWCVLVCMEGSLPLPAAPRHWADEFVKHVAHAADADEGKRQQQPAKGQPQMCVRVAVWC